MKIEFTPAFKKNYRIRIKNSPDLRRIFWEAHAQFETERNFYGFDDHPLFGKMNNFRSFSLDGDYRVIYKKMGDKVVLLDVGTHQEVYI